MVKGFSALEHLEQLLFRRVSQVLGAIAVVLVALALPPLMVPLRVGGGEVSGWFCLVVILAPCSERFPEVEGCRDVCGPRKATGRGARLSPRRGMAGRVGSGGGLRRCHGSGLAGGSAHAQGERELEPRLGQQPGEAGQML